MACPLAATMLAVAAWPWWKERRVVITEGEPDFLTWATRGEIPRNLAVLGVGGAGQWTEAFADRIPDDSSVIIRTDPDDTGGRLCRRDRRLVVRAVPRARERLRRPRPAPTDQGRTRCRAPGAAEDPGDGAVMPVDRSGAAMDDNDLARAGKLPADPAEGTAEVPARGARSMIEGPEGSGKAKRLAALIQQRTKLVLAPTGRKCALAGGVAHPCDSADFIGWCSNVFWKGTTSSLPRA
jgi:hypothetical protein